MCTTGSRVDLVFSRHHHLYLYDCHKTRVAHVEHVSHFLGILVDIQFIML